MELSKGEMRLNHIWCAVRVFAIPFPWQHNPMVVSGTYPPISINLGSNKPGLTLQRQYQEGGRLIWRDVVKDGQVVKSPVDADGLPTGKYRLI